MKTIYIAIFVIGILAFSAFSQDDNTQSIDLRDGTSLQAEIVGVDDDGLNVMYQNDIELKIPWNYLDPDAAYSIKRAIMQAEVEHRSGDTNFTTKDYLELAKWCNSQDLSKHAEEIYKLIINTLDTDNSEARKELGYVRHNKKWYKAEEWEKEVAKTDSKTEKTEPEPGEEVKRKIRLKLKIVMTHKMNSRTPEIDYSQDLETVLKNKLEEMGYKVVTSNADYYIEGSAFVNQTKAVTFMNDVLSVKFEGDLSFSIKDPENKEIKKDKVVGRSGRNDLKQAVDDLFDSLATSAVSKVLTICKK